MNWKPTPTTAFVDDLSGDDARTFAEVATSGSVVSNAVLFAITNSESVCEQFWGNSELQAEGFTCIKSIMPSKTLILTTWDEQRHQLPMAMHAGFLLQFIRVRAVQSRQERC